MTDKERILSDIMGTTCFYNTKDNFDRNPHTYWEYVGEDTKLSKGDVVCGMTGQLSNYKIAFFKEKINPSHLVVQEIGGKKECNYSNERFLVLRGFRNCDLLCGHEYKVMLKIQKALYDIYMWRFSDIEYNKNKTITIIIREKWTQKFKTVHFVYDKPLSRITLKEIRSFLEKELKES